MKAACWYGTKDIRVENVPDPTILNPGDAILRVTSTAICGSDLHIYDGTIMGMEDGDILGHEFMGEVVETGPGVRKLKKGDRVVVPFNIACGRCFFCEKTLWSLCDNSNPQGYKSERIFGQRTSGLFGYSKLFGGYAGGQAEYVRVPYADVGPIRIPEGIPDEKVLFLTDIFPTGYMAAENGNIEPGDTVAVWGCGPVGQFAIRSAFLLGAGKVIAIDFIGTRRNLAAQAGAIPLDAGEEHMTDALRELSGGRGPDVCIDAVGFECHGDSFGAKIDAVKAAVKLAPDRGHVLRQAILACRKGGTLSVPGVYAGLADSIPTGMMMNKALTIKTGQTHTHRYLAPLLKRIEKGEIDPSFVISHRLDLVDAAEGYKTFYEKNDGCTKVVLKP
jgi:threonine dehydrogenase-like Zn-dependent dehydrogenase